jgi:hypothetical protein
MKFAIITLLSVAQAISLAKKDEEKEKPVWREEQPDLFSEADSVDEVESSQAFKDLNESEKF